MRGLPTCDVHGLPRGCATEKAKADYIESLTKKAAENYGLILTRYPVMNRSDDAKKRLEALHQAVPRPTKAEVAQNRAEEESRHESTTVQKLMGIIRKGPDVASAAGRGEPNLVEPTPVAASTVIRSEAMDAMGPPRKGSIGIDIVTDKPAPDASAPPVDGATPASPFGQPGANAQPAGPDPNELKPNAPDPNELKPADIGGDQALPPPPQVNEIQSGPSSSSTATASADSAPATDQEISSSKKKRKKGLKKIVPF